MSAVSIHNGIEEAPASCLPEAGPERRPQEVTTSDGKVTLCLIFLPCMAHVWPYSRQCGPEGKLHLIPVRRLVPYVWSYWVCMMQYAQDLWGAVVLAAYARALVRAKQQVFTGFLCDLGILVVVTGNSALLEHALGAHVSS